MADEKYSISKETWWERPGLLLLLAVLMAFLLVITAVQNISATLEKKAQASAQKALDSRLVVTLYDGAGKPIRSWESAGVVAKRDVGDTSYRFMDKKTGEIVAINGTYTVESK